MAPAGSKTMASSLYRFNMEEHICPSGIVITRSITSLQIGNVYSPIDLTAMPSAKESICSSDILLFSFIDCVNAAAPWDSKAIILVLGECV